MSTHEHHNHDEPSHGSRPYKRRALIYAIGSLITLGVVVLQYHFAILAHSLSLLSDTIHAGGDLTVISGTFIVEIVCLSLSTRYENILRSFFAYLGIALLLIGGIYVLHEAHLRIITPQKVASVLVITIASIGLFGNFLVHILLHTLPSSDSTHNHSILSAHVLADILLSLAVIGGNVCIFYFQTVNIDPHLSSGVAVYMIFLSGTLFKQLQLGATSCH